MKREGRLHLDDAMKAFQRYVATEILRYAKQNGRAPEDLSDKGKSTLYTWRSEPDDE